MDMALSVCSFPPNNSCHGMSVVREPAVDCIDIRYCKVVTFKDVTPGARCQWLACF